MREQRKTTINGYDYRIKQLAGTIARQQELILARAFATIVSDPENIFGGVAAALQGLTAAQYESLYQALIADAWVRPTGAADDRERSLVETESDHFAGRALDRYKFLYWSLEVNYPDFFALAATIVARARSSSGLTLLGALGLSESPTGSTTSPGSP